MSANLKHTKKMKTLVTLTTLVIAQIAYTNADLKLVSSFVTPVLKDAVAHQEANVQCMEELNFSAAPAVRAQWEEKKAKALFRIQQLEQLDTNE